MKRSGQFKSWLEDLEGWKEEKMGEFGDLIIAIHVRVIQGSADHGLSTTPRPHFQKRDQGI